MMQRLRQDIEGQAAGIASSHVAASRDTSAMRDSLQAALAGIVASVGAYGRSVAMVGGGANAGTAWDHPPPAAPLGGVNGTRRGDAGGGSVPSSGGSLLPPLVASSRSKHGSAILPLGSLSPTKRGGY